MKIQTALIAAALLAGCAEQPGTTESKESPSAQDMQMSSAEHKQMEDNAMVAEPQTAAAKTASATGTVTAIDLGSGKITIDHEPVASLQWPAMSMGFTATPEQLASVKPGQKVQFEFESEGMAATITQIAPTK